MNDWLETPVVSSTDKNYYTHYMPDDNGNEVVSSGRNWSFYWSASDQVSLWVAYPLYGKWAESNVSRKDAYAPDPFIDDAKQPATGGYSGNYSKGHQIPSADRLGSRAINNSVFYMTNMTPQDQTFNGGLWAQLETQVRTWADASDEFYVVTGCVVKGSTKTTSSNGLTVTVPAKYYKALLRKKGSTYTACAYIYDHFTSQTKFSESDRISVDRLEELTGIDFFPNLIGIVGETTAANIEKTATAF